MSKVKKKSWKQAKWLDDDNGSTLCTRVTWCSHFYPGFGKHENKPSESSTPEISIHISDCSRRIQLHDFGESRAEAQKKIKILRDSFDKLSEQVDKAWDEYDAFWAEQKEED